MKRTFTGIRWYWPLIKSPQTALLVTTGLAGFISARCPLIHPSVLAGLLISLLASISGSTILNMWWDRDIDAKMGRTQKRPLASGKIEPGEAFWAGMLLSLFGVGLAAAMSFLYGLIIFAGLFFDVVIYTIWLKRRTCWGILWGGVSGAMPILAGRALGLGSIDWVGIMLALSILFWIPTHILTFSMRYDGDYRAAGVPTVASTYGYGFTRAVIVVSTLLAALGMGLASWGIGMEWGFLRLLCVLSAGMLVLAIMMIFRPSERVNFGLFKYASLYMLSAMVLMML